MEFQGKVKSIELYGAFIDIGVWQGCAAAHFTTWQAKCAQRGRCGEESGETITVYILKVEPKSGRIALSMEKPPELPMTQIRVGDVITGKVVRIESFGAFVEIGAERPGMIHVSELATDFIQSPDDVVKLNEEVQVKVIKVNRKEASD